MQINDRGWKMMKHMHQQVLDIVSYSALTSDNMTINTRITLLTGILDKMKQMQIFPDAVERHRLLQATVLHLRTSYCHARHNDWAESDYHHHLALINLETLNALLERDYAEAS